MSSKEYKIDFKLIQAALLPKLQDKQFLQTLILSVSVTDQIILNSSIKNLPITLQTSVAALGLQSALDSSVLLSSLYRLTKQLVGLSIDQAKQKAKQLFPSDFDSKLRNGILNQVFQNYDEIRSQFIKSKSALSKLKDFDWRIETQIASKYQKDTKPTLLLRLDTQKEVGMTKSTTLQLPRSKVKEMLNVFHRIDSQLKAITGKN